ncbi:MAG: hypothetical protein NWE90_04555 [Candidatus Bathyarchaeota archaeon]|nr:hypothetical protein [Candidatus Bathyarchaeota archaeon]
MFENYSERRNLNVISILIILTLVLQTSSFNVEHAVCTNENNFNSFSSNILTDEIEIPKFEIAGENYLGEKISISEKGGIIEISGEEFFFFPWKHISWTENNVNVIFVANVTESNFRIGFLFLTNGSSSFDVKIFEYTSATYQKMTFQGKTFITNDSVKLKRTFENKISIIPSGKIDNRLFATGPSLFIVSHEGKLKVQSSFMKLYVVHNTINPTSGWNELWTLGVTESEDYYFNIFYMNIKNKSDIIFGHSLCLNDYAVLEQKELDSTWFLKGEGYQLSVMAPLEIKSLWVDGFHFKRTDDSKFHSILNEGSHTILIENGTSQVNGVRFGFNNWSDGIDTNPRIINLDSNVTLSAEYSREFLLTVDSLNPDGDVSGWYDEGEEVQLPIFIDHEKGDIKYILEDWSGDINVNENSTFVLMDAPKSVHANWRRLYKVIVSSEGLPANSSLIYTINKVEIVLRSNETAYDWVEEDSLIQINASIQSTSSVEEFFLDHWKSVEIPEIIWPIRIYQPEQFTAVFTNQKRDSKLSCDLSNTYLMTTGQLIIKGNLDPTRETKVIIEYRVSGQKWDMLAEVETDIFGNYEYYWYPNVTGIIQIRAVWLGDITHNPTMSQTESIAISQSMLKFKRLASTFNTSTSLVYDELNGPQNIERELGLPFTFGMNIVDTLYVELSTIRPFGSIVAIVVGSAIIGFFYIFPWAILISVVAITARKRSINKKLLLPLFILWGISFSYLILHELNVTFFIEHSRYLLTVLTATLASVTGLLIAFLPSFKITNQLAKRWQSNEKHPIKYSNPQQFRSI